MFGDLFSFATKVVTLPLDIANTAVDVVTGEDGSKNSRTKIPVLGDLEAIRDGIAVALEDEK